MKTLGMNQVNKEIVEKEKIEKITFPFSLQRELEKMKICPFN